MLGLPRLATGRRQEVEAWDIMGFFLFGMFLGPRNGLVLIQWIGLRENLQETMVFTMKYGVFL